MARPRASFLDNELVEEFSGLTSLRTTQILLIHERGRRRLIRLIAAGRRDKRIRNDNEGPGNDTKMLDKEVASCAVKRA
jgi:hypothetical protein